jgi:enoyl-CoA hydratase
MVTVDTPAVELERGEAEGATTLTVRLNRPEKRNALDLETVRALRNLLGELHEEPGPALLLTGAGPVTTAGADVAVIGSDDDDARAEFVAATNRLLHLVETYPRPTVMAVEGAAVGIGFQLAVAADFAVLGADATFLKPEIEYGVFSAYSTAMLEHRFGAQVAKEIALAGREIDPERALEWGIATDVVPGGEAEPRATALLDDLAGHEAGAYRATKAALTFEADPEAFENYP